MKRFRFQSLQVRLVVRLASLYIIATVIATSVLIYGAYDTASSLNDRELNGRAEDLAHAVSRDGAGQTRLSLPARLASAYADSTDDIFAVRDAGGHLLAASPVEFGAQVSKWPLAKDDPSYFHLTDLGTREYYGLSVELASAAGPVSISVARAAGANTLVSSLLRDLLNVPGAADFTPAEAAFLLDNSKKDAGTDDLADANVTTLALEVPRAACLRAARTIR